MTWRGLQPAASALAGVQIRMTIYCATTNSGKLREFRLAAPDFDIQTITGIDAPEETGATFEANAILKATHYGAHTPGYLFADDSGLEVDALSGAPGVHSARFAGPDATDADNNALLLERLQGVENRTARFVCVIALVHNGALVQTFRDTVEGHIIDAPRGMGGFGYDPLFYVPFLAQTFGDAPIERKMKLSHRGQALAKMFAYLRNTVSR
ncbi:MAG TPA: RdgB/HAM1 family non-canonical purine NTP pyrophosphatase [Bryobacteraceae bacterium]|nr:RdgB/HAM1 family non-canonical purine NTP pyrophosphatase [Bryobacteraceae bacterium]